MTMSRLIDADAFKQTFCAECVRTQCENCNINNHFKHLAPTVDTIKHGHNTNDGVRWFRCSECGWGMNDIYMADESMVEDFDKFPYYCPYCGAKIDEPVK